MRAAGGAFVAVLTLLTGCLGGAGDSATIHWGSLSKQCINGDCTYGQNQERLDSQVECTGSGALSWRVWDWAHGSIRVRVLDGSGAVLHDVNLRSDQSDSKALKGSSGEWKLTGQTQNANGNLRAELACIRQ